MPEADLINSLFKQDNLIPVVTHYERKKVRLEEEGEPDSFVDIFNLPDDTIVIDLDKNFANDLLVSGEKGSCKRADFMLISAEAECVVFIEMKRRNPTTRGDINNQLRGSFCVFKYCSILMEQFFQDNFLSSYKTRFVIFRHTHINKRPTRESSGTVNDTPESASVIAGQKTVQFNQIARLNA